MITFVRELPLLELSPSLTLINSKKWFEITKKYDSYFMYLCGTRSFTIRFLHHMVARRQVNDFLSLL